MSDEDHTRNLTSIIQVYGYDIALLGNEPNNTVSRLMYKLPSPSDKAHLDSLKWHEIVMRSNSLAFKVSTLASYFRVFYIFSLPHLSQRWFQSFAHLVL